MKHFRHLREAAVLLATGVVIVCVVYIFIWAGASMMTACLGFAPVWGSCLLVIMCIYILPYMRK